VKVSPVLERKRIFPQQPVLLSMLLVLAVIAGCQISPRRIAVNTGPTPSPGITPTVSPTPGGIPTPSPTISPIPATPTPSPMAATATVPQFVFVAASGSPAGSISGFKVESDGSLSPLPQGTVPLAEPTIKMLALDGRLAVVGQKRVSLFAVDSATGMLHLSHVTAINHLRVLAPRSSVQSPFVLDANNQLMLQSRDGHLTATGISVTETGASLNDSTLNDSAEQSPSTSVLTRDQQFMYVLDRSASQLRAFRAEGNHAAPLTPEAYPVAKGTSALAIVSMPQ
jgi:hypothetical protein